jgi:hypothetical protein
MTVAMAPLRALALALLLARATADGAPAERSAQCVDDGADLALLQVVAVNPGAKPEGAGPGTVGLGQEAAATGWQVKSVISDAVHEGITYDALKAAGVSQAPQLGNGCPDPKVSEVVRGAVWNDDPVEMLWCNPDPADTCPISLQDCGAAFKLGSGAQFGSMFKLVCSGPTHGVDATDYPISLMCNTHYGRLQFLHGMAVAAGDAPTVTQRQMLAYAEFAYGVAIGSTAPATPVLQAVGGELRAAFAGSKVAPTTTVKELFVMVAVRPYPSYDAPWVDVPHRAIGSLAHMLEDSYAGQHAARVGGVGPVLQFRDYSGQDSKLHGKYDETPVDESSRARRQGALDAAALVLRSWQEKQPWSEVSAQLLQGPLALAPGAVSGGSGQVNYAVAFTTGDLAGAGTINSVTVAFCFKDGSCTQAEQLCGLSTPTCFPKSSTTTYTALQADFGCISKITLSKTHPPVIGDDWYLVSVAVAYPGQICGQQRATFAVNAWIKDSMTRTFAAS